MESRVDGRLGYLFVPLPAVLVGALLMHRHDVSATLWSLQIGAALIGTVACIGAAVIARPSPERPLRWVIVAVLAVAMVAVTLAFPGVEGVRRWIPAGPLQLHAAAIALPVLLLALGAVIRSGAGAAIWAVQGLAVLAVLALVAQPDASQATAFGVSAAVLILLHDRRRTAAWLVAGTTVGLAMFAWTRPDPLLPVPLRVFTRARVLRCSRVARNRDLLPAPPGRYNGLSIVSV